MTDEEAAASLKEIDTSGDGKISFSEFLKWWQSDRLRRSTSDAADSKLKHLRLRLLTKYTGVVAENAAAELQKKLPMAKELAAKSQVVTPAPPGPNGLDSSFIVIEVAANIGNAPTKCSIKVANIVSDPARTNELEVVFSLSAGCTAEQANQMRDALGCIVQMIPPSQLSSPSVVINGKQLVVKGVLPDDAKAAAAAKGYTGILPSEAQMEFQLDLSQDFSASDPNEPLCLKSAFRVKFPRTFLGVVEMLTGANEPPAAAPATPSGEGDPPAAPVESESAKVQQVLALAKVFLCFRLLSAHLTSRTGPRASFAPSRSA